MTWDGKGRTGEGDGRDRRCCQVRRHSKIDFSLRVELSILSLSLSLSIRPKRISMEASQARPGAANGNGMEVAARQSSSGGETENGRVGV